MRDAPDAGLLEQFVQSESEAAFAALVERHINLVYSTALRHTANPHHAQEITQAVFIILARKAADFAATGSSFPAGFTTRRGLTAANFQRAEWRRIRREQEAYMQNRLDENASDAELQRRPGTRSTPLLDGALEKLGRKEITTPWRCGFSKTKVLREVGADGGGARARRRMRVSRAHWRS